MKLNQIIRNKSLNSTVTLMDIYNPYIAKKSEPGEFIIIRPFSNSERIPLTIAGYNKEEGIVTIIFQIVGGTTMELNRLKENDVVNDFVGPLGNPTNLTNLKKVCIIGGGVGCAIAYPVAKKLHDNNATLHSIIGFRNKDLVILEDEFKSVSDKLIVMTDDGSYQEKGLVTNALEKLIKEGNEYDAVIAIGPLIMMKFVTEITKKYNIKTIVSMNSIMIDGTGMCGCCRLSYDGKIKFACIDGPDFDAFKIDFDEAISRSKTYLDFEKRKREENCNLMKEAKDE